ncbi:flagellar biosynthetic protein FliR [Saccharospirillum salsuginis]|uniref:Flagellar biosynthetic protein FliR n=1 Tax=Saccharospirillum salsuginis TaxID=418750 RepID=A0A918K7B9_9GAMM|nr:flagellar biosynthetic protein FliR [Saccharospirillum salsuginis]GGX50794.1 flagellar biosynthetic protein FliR [Saccharospirillum salsuginis]
MEISDAQIASWVSHFMWPFFRIGAFLMIVPVLGAQVVPTRVRLGLAFMMTIAVSPLLPPMPVIEVTGMESLVIIAQQVLIGLTLGYIVLTILQVFILAGQTISMQMGLGFASMVDPANGISVAVLSQWYQVLVTLVFLAINGHLVVIEVMAESFSIMPVGPVSFSRESFMAVAEFGAWLFQASLMLALPAISALLLVNLTFGIMTRAAPQLNVFVLGFPITMLAGLVIVWASYWAAFPMVQELLNEHVRFMRELLLN